MRRRLLSLVATSVLCFTTAGTLVAQSFSVRYTHLASTLDLSSDLNYLYNYNRYEGSRWGYELNATWPVGHPGDSAALLRPRWHTALYAAYGYRDHRLKGGLTLQRQRPAQILSRYGLYASHDLSAVGSHRLATYSILDISNNATYLSNRYTLTDRVGAGVTLGSGDRYRQRIAMHWSRERYLFVPHSESPDAPTADIDMLLGDMPDRQPVPIVYKELNATALWHQRWTCDLLTGISSRRNPFGGNTTHSLYLRLLLQYAHEHTMRHGGLLGTHVQLGLSSANAEYSRLFDLGGTYQHYYYFQHALLTVPPHYFTANHFAQLLLCYTPSRPLWSLRFSCPRPFIQLNGLIGFLSTPDQSLCSSKDVTIALANNTTQRLDNYLLSLQAPSQGILEPALGINGLFRLGNLDLGMAVAYQWTPSSAPYHRLVAADRFAIMATLTLVYTDMQALARHIIRSWNAIASP